MKKILVVLFVLISASSFGQISLRCPLCPPSVSGQSGKVLSNNGTILQWVAGGGGSGADTSLTWLKAGNGGTNPASDFIGTTDAVDFVTKTSNATRLTMDMNGRSYQGSIGTIYSGSPLPFASFRKDTASRTWVSVENQNTTGVSGFFIGSELNTIHGVIPANSHYGYIGIATETYTNADTVVNHSMNFVSGSGNYNGMKFLCDNGSIDFLTSGTAVVPAMTIYTGSDSSGSVTPTTAGNIGIGIKKPAQDLVVKGSASGTIQLLYSGIGETATTGTILQESGGTTLWQYANSRMRFGTNNLERMSINADGTVAIGNTNNVRPLCVFEATLSGVTFQNSTTGITSNDGFDIMAIGSDGYVDNYENGNIFFRTQNIDRWTIGGTGTLTAADGINMAFNTTTGTKIGTSTSQKLGFWNVTPVVQPTTAISAAAFVANTSLIANDSATFGGYTIGQIVAALKAVGILQ